MNRYVAWKIDNVIPATRAPYAVRPERAWRVTATNLAIAGFGTVLFVGMAFVDFYTMPRTYRDDQYLSGALGMYLTYINLFIFILRLVIALQGGGRRD